jgi:hypothetical protein
MKPSDILLDIGKPVAYYSGFAKKWGPSATVFFSQMFYWHGKGEDKDHWIYKTQEEIEDETGLSADSQQTARNKLKAAGVLEEKHSRTEHRIYYRVCIDKLNEAFGEPPITQSVNPRESNRRNPDSLKGTTENTTENTIVVNKIKERKPRAKDPIHDSLVLVTKYPAGSFNGAVTAKLRKANPDKSQEWIAGEIMRRFGPGGSWSKNDWRGQQGQDPTPMQVFQEWNRVLIEKKAVAVGYTSVDLMNP